MREILFRGKSLDNGEWIYGGYHFEHGFGEDNEKHYITVCKTHGGFTYNAFVEVDAKTVGQFTGLLDKNFNKIFEGDIVSFYEVLGQKGITKPTKPFKGVVKCGNGYCYVEYINERNRKGKWNLSSCWHLKIVSNIHDNKEEE